MHLEQLGCEGRAEDKRVKVMRVFSETAPAQLTSVISVSEWSVCSAMCRA